jgi:hypothetical protein
MPEDLAGRLGELLGRTLRYVGIDRIEAGGDGEVAIVARGGGLGASYSADGLWGGEYHETGAELAGTFEVRIGSEVARRRFAARVTPPEAIAGPLPETPFDQAAGLPVRNGFDLYSDLAPAAQTLVAQWLLFLREHGGPSVSRAALADTDGEQSEKGPSPSASRSSAHEPPSLTSTGNAD